VNTHIIRLRGHWKRDELSHGRVRHSRPFGQPRIRDTAESVWLVGQRAPGDGALHLNDQYVGPLMGGEAFAFDVTAHLRARNIVAIELPANTHWDGELLMEIRASET
jgi:hypothetical protein